MRRSRHVIAVIVVATALSADRAIQAAPQSRPHVTQLARTFASKLSTGLQRAVPVITLLQDRREGEAQPASPGVLAAVSPPAVHTAEGTPFRFRLPPPAH